MKAKLMLLLLLLVASIAWSDEVVWLNDIDKALAQAQSQKRMVFVDVYTEWCSWCKKLDQETFPDPRFQEAAADFILLKVDADKELDFKVKYQLYAYPTLLFLKGNGDEVKRIKGFRDAPTLVAEMQSVLAGKLEQGKRGWYYDIATAFAEAKASGRLLFVDVYTEWCSWCKKLDAETFATSEFQQLGERFVLLKVDADKELAFKVKYQVYAYPTMLFLDGDGNQVHRLKGFMTIDKLLPEMQKVLQQNRSELPWYHDIAAALAKAKASNRLLFVDVYTEWCSWCKKLDAETFATSEFQQQSQNFVLLKVDADKELEFKVKYQVYAYPTMLFLDGDGKEVYRIKGFLQAPELVKIIQQILGNR